MDRYEVGILVPGAKKTVTIDISSSSEGDGAAARLDASAVKLEEADVAVAKDSAAKREEDDAATARRDVKLTRRGPKIKGGKTWDRFCVYPNLVEMYPRQVEILRFLVDQKRPTIPFYVCTIKNATTQEGKSRMYFTRKFTQRFILRNMHLPDDHLVVSYNEGSCVKVRIIMGKGRDAGAMITTNWRAVVQKSNMKDNDIFVFWFRMRSRGGLKLYVRKLEK